MRESQSHWRRSRVVGPHPAPSCRIKPHGFWLQTGDRRVSRRAQIPANHWWTAAGSNHRPRPCRRIISFTVGRHPAPRSATVSVRTVARVPQRVAKRRPESPRVFAGRLPASTRAAGELDDKGTPQPGPCLLRRPRSRGRDSLGVAARLAPIACHTGVATRLTGCHDPRRPSCSRALCLPTCGPRVNAAA